MRIVFNNLRSKIAAYRNYRKLAQNMKDRYLDVPAEELEALDDVCAVCHDRMESAKKLPCGHIFHQ
jgi:autocrine motility factor receptor